MHRHDARGRGFGSRGIELALGRELRERLADLPLRRLRGAHAVVEQLHAMAGLRRDLRDARAHRAGADDADFRGCCGSAPAISGR